MSKLRVADLFSGIGGFSLGLERTGGFETVSFCEIDPFCRKVLARHWPDVPCHEDITKLRGEDVGTVDVVCGGFPCQPWSEAGQRRGKDDDRHLWPEMARLVREIQPAWVIGENVSGIVSLGLDDVLDDLEAQGYATWQALIPAAAIGAPHRRDRVWIIAHAESQQMGRTGQSWQEAIRISPNAVGIARQRRAKDARRQTRPRVKGYAADAAGERLEGWPRSERQIGASDLRPLSARQDQSLGGHFCTPQPPFCRVDDGIPRRMGGSRREQLSALGNAVVPQIPELIGHAILAAHQQRSEAA